MVGSGLAVPNWCAAMEISKCSARPMRPRSAKPLETVPSLRRGFNWRRAGTTSSKGVTALRPVVKISMAGSAKAGSSPCSLSTAVSAAWRNAHRLILYVGSLCASNWRRARRLSMVSRWTTPGACRPASRTAGFRQDAAPARWPTRYRRGRTGRPVCLFCSSKSIQSRLNYALIRSMWPIKLPVQAATPKTIAIVGKYHAVGIAQSLSDIAAFLEAHGHTIVFEAETAQNVALEGYDAMSPEQIGQFADAAIVVGGDGTMLGIARQLAPFNVPLIGINQGRLGFMTDISLDRMIPVLADMLDGKVDVETRSLLEATVYRDGEQIFNALAFNDVVVARGASSGMVELTVEVDGRFMYNQRSDGLIVATPTGSTAYALSAGGPILHPSLHGIVLVPIAPHALSNRPIVIPDSCEISIRVVNGRDISANFDMQSLTSLTHGDLIVIKRSAHKITFLHPEGWSYYDTLRQKLHWNEYPSVEGRLQ